MYFLSFFLASENSIKLISITSFASSSNFLIFSYCNKFLRKELQLTKEVEEYFILKIIYKNNSYFASDKLKEVVYNKFYNKM